MNSSKDDFGGSFSVDGENIEVDLAEFGWDREPTAPAKPQFEDEGRIRLQKALANAGVASRRACETLITSGRVMVNGEVQREMGSRIDPLTDDVRVDGVVVQLDVSKRYFVLNKPRGIVSTMHDEDGRPDLREFTDQLEDRLYNVGRLDTDTSGLLILTNDGDLAHKLAHPSFGVQKTYVAKVRGRVLPATIQQLRDGIELADGPIRVDRAKLLPGGSGKTHSLIEVTLHSGRNRIVRRMLAEVGHPVEELVRRQFGPLNLGTLRVGEMRELSAGERGALLSAADDGGTVSPHDPEAPARTDKQGRDRGPVTGGRPGDGKGARGMRGIAAKGNPHGQGGPSGSRDQGNGRNQGGSRDQYGSRDQNGSRGQGGPRGSRGQGNGRGGSGGDFRRGGSR